MEPLSIIAIGAAIGGAAGKFVEKAWDSGEKWIQTYFKNHNKASQEKATENTMEFLNELGQKVKLLEDSNQIPKEKIESAQDHPDFSALLQKALLASAQTDSKNKHAILARLVSERLKSEPESILALCSKMACDAISYASTNQLMFLGLAVYLLEIRPTLDPALGINEINFQEWMDNWVTKRLKPFQQIKFRPIDITHLESLSCIKVNTSITSNNINGKFDMVNLKYDFEKMKDAALRESMKRMWNDAYYSISLLTVGQIIGVSVSDLLTNTNTKFEGWN